MFTAAPFSKAKTWKQTNCPPTEGWIKKTGSVHINVCGIFLSHKKECNNAICRDYHTK